jgi:hypothetical protein
MLLLNVSFVSSLCCLLVWGASASVFIYFSFSRMYVAVVVRFLLFLHGIDNGTLGALRCHAVKAKNTIFTQLGNVPHNGHREPAQRRNCKP